MRTDDPDYARRLATLEGAWWKRLLDVQRPYRRFLQGLELGPTLEVGCGLGRLLAVLPPGSVGVDHNPRSVELALGRGLEAFTPEGLEAAGRARPERFESLLLAHVAEHLSETELDGLLRRYLPLVKRGGRVVVITPQEAGHRSDPTHVRFMDFAAVEGALRAAGLEPLWRRSFPFPRWVGRFFRYNEFVSVARRP